MMRLSRLAVSILLASAAANAFIMSPFDRWHCIDFVNNIDKAKPYAYNIGELPLVAWFDKHGDPQTTVNICSHMGSTLNHGKINKEGCLVCPYHGLVHNKNKTFGKSLIFQDKLWWSYAPIQETPPAMPFYNNKNYETSFFSYTVDSNIIDTAYNLMDVNHPAFVHNNPLGFGSSIPPSNFKVIKYPKNNHKIGLSFMYSTNKNLHSIKRELQRSKNFHIFEYPYTTWSRVSLPNNEQLFLNVNFLPISDNKTKMLITVKHNFWKSSLEKRMIDFMTYCVFSQDRDQMIRQADETPLKKLVMHQHVMHNEEHILMMKSMFQNYRVPNSDDVMQLYKAHLRSQ
jgi:phenylpropionate dioxygenase-like ring-hydroxylating dioxygenase large terminal subunit